MFLHDTLQPFYPVWDCSVCSSKGVELCMDGFSPLLSKETKSNMSITPLCQVNLPVLQQSNIMYYVVFKFLLPVVLIKELSDLLDQIWYEHKWGSPQFFSTRGTH
eukprot:Em0006g720a